MVRTSEWMVEFIPSEVNFTSHMAQSNHSQSVWASFPTTRGKLVGSPCSLSPTSDSLDLGR